MHVRQRGSLIKLSGTPSLQYKAFSGGVDFSFLYSGLAVGVVSPAQQ